MTSVYWVFLLLLIPLIGGAFAWWKLETIVLWEWCVSFVVAGLILALVFGVANKMAGSDEEVFSGHAYQACHTPKWRAEWMEAVTHTSTDSKGNVSTTVTYETRSETHDPEWWLETTIGSISIGESLYTTIADDHGSYSRKGYRPNYDSGDKYDYFADIKDPPGVPEYPVHMLKQWDNPLVGTGTINLGKKVSEEEARELGLHDYPDTSNRLHSKRVIGADHISTYRWDQMCAVLGPHKKVNLTVINFGAKDMSIAVKQRDYWRNGKKNDIVICYGVGWSYVFGWSKSSLVKQELQDLFLEKTVNDHILPDIKEIVLRDFEPYEWKQHDGTPRPVNTLTIIVAAFIMAASQVGLGFFFHSNGYQKDGQHFVRRKHSFYR